MNSKLKSALLSGPKTVKELATLIEQPVSVTRSLLKDDQATIRCRKNDNQQNAFWLEADDNFEASEAELAQQATRQEVQAEKANQTPPAETPADPGSSGGANTCPLCQAEADQVQSGPEGSYLGACRTCSACNKTYNVFSREEINMAKNTKTEGSKRAAPLNPQYKINQRIAAAEQAGGKLTYQREGRTWLLSKKGVEPKTMSAQEFSNETAETIHKHLGFTPPAPAPKAEKPAKAPKAAKATGGKGSKTTKAPKAEKVDELV